MRRRSYVKEPVLGLHSHRDRHRLSDAHIGTQWPWGLWWGVLRIQNWKEAYLAFKEIYVDIKKTGKAFIISRCLEKMLNWEAGGKLFFLLARGRILNLI